VEWAFEVLQSKFVIIAKPSKLWNTDTIKVIIQACIILHNMIIEDENLEDHLEPLFHLRALLQLRRTFTFESLTPKEHC
jgi:hypothetical protein